MSLLVALLKAIWKFVYFFMKILLPTNPKKVTFLSKQRNTPSTDFILLQKSLLKKDDSLKITFVLKKIEVTPFGIISYFFHTFTQMYHIATSKVCIVDGYVLSVCVLKHKKNLFVLQIWHALGAIKKFGYQIDYNSNTFRSKLAIAMDNHRNYDLVISGSKKMIPFFSEAFDMNKEKFIPAGAPKIDYLISKEKTLKERIYEKYPAFKDKKIILYAPTFHPNKEYKINELIDAIDFNEYILIVKMHPNISGLIEVKEGVETCPNFSSFRLLSVADYVITDYSAISIEAAAINKPIYFYVYDYEEYEKNNGLNINLYKEMPNCVFKEPISLMDAIKNQEYNYDQLTKFKNDYVANINNNATSIITNIIYEHIN